MEVFWRWMLGANARALFLCSVLALLLVVGWWVWKEFSPQHANMAQPRNPPGLQSQESLQILAFLDSQSSPLLRQAPPNPFLTPGAKPRRRVTRRPRPQPQAEQERAAKAVQAQPTAKAGQAQGKKSTQPERAPDGKDTARKPAKPRTRTSAPPETVSLTYRGMFERNGRVMVLVEDSRSGRASFHDPEDGLFGLNVGSVEPESLQVKTPEGAEVDLLRGKSEVFEGGKHVD